MTLDQTVFIVDDDEAYRDSVKELVNSVGMSAESYGSALEFLEAFAPARPGCLVLDVRMMRMSGIALQTKLATMGARLPIVFISGHGDIEMAVKAIKDGAVDFVQKPYREQQLLDAIDEALRRDADWRNESAHVGPAKTGDHLAERVASLTEREREVMALALGGVPSKLIAKQLSLSHRTVEHHRSRLLEKFGVGSIFELMRLLRKEAQSLDAYLK
ncbi:response regulator transcription factor [Variovorax rhizosphaerae]|uniref:Response regulator n=1 Tax=Variovorax rhizosphaerae TaxID=1836200 RepID=A0ABU8X062_9BURK